MPAFELNAFFDDVHARLKTAAPAPKTVATADDFKDALERAVNLPSVFTIYKGSKSSGRLVQNSRKQLRNPLKLFLAIVTQNLMSRDQAHVAAYDVLQPWEDILAGYTPVGCMAPLIFDGDYLVLRQGPKIVYGAEFRTKALDFTT